MIVVSQAGVQRYEVCKVMARRPLEVVQEAAIVHEDEVDNEVGCQVVAKSLLGEKCAL